jgi:hypothetical protein
MEENSRTDGRAVRFKYIRMVPVLRQMARIDRTTLKIAVDGNPVFRIQLLSDLGPYTLEDCILSLQVVGPTNVIEFLKG